MPDVNNLLDPAWANFTLVSTGGIVYAQQQLAIPTVDVTHFVTSYTVAESVREVARTLEFTLDTGDSPDAWRVQLGSDIALYQDVMDRTGGVAPPGPFGNIWFYGKVYDKGREESPGTSTRRFKAYDGLTRLARTEDALVYTDKTMTQIAQDMCARYGYAVNEMVDTEVPVGQIIQGPGVSCAQVLEEAAQRTLRRSGRHFFVRPNIVGNALELWEMGYTGVQWNVSSGVTSWMLDYNEEDSAEQLRTAVSLVTEETSSIFRATVLGSREDETDPYHVVFGKLPSIIAPDNTTDAPTNDQQLDAEYALRNRSIKTATLRNLIMPGARQGDMVVFTLPDGTVVTAYIATIITAYTVEPQQTTELVFDALTAA